MTITALSDRTYTGEEYLDLEVESDVRCEYRNGKIVPMTGGTPAHNDIIRMFVFLLTAALRKQPYSIFVTDQRLWIPDPDLYTYPDVMVTPRPVDLKPGRNDTVMNPILLAEVLSGSTEGYDRGDKFLAYRSMTSFQEYLLIAQEAPHVEHYVKQGENQWLFTEYRGFDKSFTLQSVAVTIALADLYEASLEGE
ncbi:MAG: Uma2 family endonuclease [Elainellaceae cyanobacterium]